MTDRLERVTGSFEHEGHTLVYDVIGEGGRTVVLTHGLLMSRKMHLPNAKAKLEYYRSYAQFHLA